MTDELVPMKLLTAAQESGTKYMLEARQARRERDAAKKTLEILSMYLHEDESNHKSSIPRISDWRGTPAVDPSEVDGLLVPLRLFHQGRIPWNTMRQVFAAWLYGRRKWTPEDFGLSMWSEEE